MALFSSGLYDRSSALEAFCQSPETFLSEISQSFLLPERFRQQRLWHDKHLAKEEANKATWRGLGSPSTSLGSHNWNTETAEAECTEISRQKILFTPVLCLLWGKTSAVKEGTCQAAYFPVKTRLCVVPFIVVYIALCSHISVCRRGSSRSLFLFGCHWQI